MTVSLTLTFAELELVLALRPTRGAKLRRDLSLNNGGEASAPLLARAGLASLLARELCETVAADSATERSTLPDLRFGGELAVLLDALSDDAGSTSVAAAWCGERASTVHLVDGRGARMALFPERFGRFRAEALDPAEPISAPLSRFLALHLAEGIPSAFVATTARGESSASVALAVDAAGQWSASDSAVSPDHAVPVTREWAMERIAELFDADPAVAQSEAR